MMVLTVAMAAGLLLATAVMLIVFGVRPPLPPLDRRVAVVLQPDAAVAGPTVWRRWRDLLIARTPPSVAPDLALLGRTTSEFVTARLIWTTVGLTATGLLASLAGTPVLLVPLAALTGAAGGWYLALHELRDAATKRRATLGLALAAWTQMAAMMIRAGLGVEQAMRQAAADGTHWTFRTLHHAMARAVDDHRPLWHALAELGDDTDVSELQQLAAELRLTETVGGTPTDALLARAAILRDQQLADQLAAAATAEVKQAIPLALLGICLTGFVVYPAIEAFLAT